MTENKRIALMLTAPFVLLIIGWIGFSYFQAKAYNQLTNNHVYTWQAMFVRLHVNGNMEVVP